MTLLRVMYLMQQGASLTQAVDHAVVEGEEIPPEQWADVRDVTERAITKSIEEAEEAAGLVDEDAEQAELEP